MPKVEINMERLGSPSGRRIVALISPAAVAGSTNLVLSASADVTDEGSAQPGAFPADELPGSLGTLDFATDGMAVNLGVNPGDVSTYAQDIADAGFKWVRSRIVWESVEQSEGVYTWTAAPNYDRIVDEFNALGIGVMFMFRGDNTSVYGSDADEPYTAAGRTAFANWMAAAVTHWSSDKVMFELQNEPNIPNFWPIDPADGIQGVVDAADEYTALADVVIPALRSANENVMVIGPGLANRGGPYSGGQVGAQEYMERLDANGTLDDLDRVSIHFYTAEGDDPEDPLGTDKAPEEAWISLYRTLLNIDADTNIINSEQGWKGAQGDATEKRLQASYNVRDHIFGLSQNVRFRVWYLWGNSGGQTDWYIKDTPTENAAAVLEQELSGYRYMSRFDTGNSDQYVYLFEEPGGDQVLACWKRDSTVATNATYAASDDATLVDYLGNTSTLTESGGNITIPLATDPAYVRLP